MTSEESGELLELAEASGLVHCTNFNLRFFPLVLEARARVASRGARRRAGTSTAATSRTGSSTPPTGTGGSSPRRVGCSARSATSARTGWTWRSSVSGRRIVEVCADLHTTIPVRRRPVGEVETFASADDLEREDAPMATEDIGHVLVRFEGGARGAFKVSQGSRRAQEPPPLRGRRVGGGARVERRAARGALARPPRRAERDRSSGTRALMQPGAAARTPSCRRAIPRAGSTRSVSSTAAVYAAVAAGWPPGRAGVSDLRRRAPRQRAGRSDRPVQRRAAMGGGSDLKLGLLTAAFPRHASRAGRVVGVRATGSRCSRSRAGPRREASAAATPGSRTSTSPGSTSARCSDVLDRNGLEISSLAYYPNNLHPDPGERRDGERPPAEGGRCSGEARRAHGRHVRRARPDEERPGQLPRVPEGVAAARRVRRRRRA